jgi:hypothetical protein
VVQTISRRIIRTLRRLGYLEAGIDAAVATGRDPLVDDARECARPLAPHSHLRGAIIPTPRQPGMDEEATDTGAPRWSWVRLRKRVFTLDMVHCPWCQRGALRIIAAIMQGEVIRKILRHLKLAVDPPPMAPARVRQEALAWSSAWRASCVTDPSPTAAMGRDHAAAVSFSA